MLRNWMLRSAQHRMREAAGRGARSSTDSEQNEEAPGVNVPPPVCHVGIVFALGIEAGGFVDRLAGVFSTKGPGFVAREGGLQGRRMVVVEAGAGRQAAARATEALLLGHHPRWVISAGFAGGLDDHLRRGDILLADEVVDAGGRALAIDIKLNPDGPAEMRRVHVGRLLTVDRVVARVEEKKNLGIEHRSLGVDMESFAVAEVCRQRKVRFLSVRVISDPLDKELPRDIDRLVKKKTVAGRLGAATGAILRRPSSVQDMWRLREDALLASERLATFLLGVVKQLPD